MVSVEHTSSIIFSAQDDAIAAQEDKNRYSSSHDRRGDEQLTHFLQEVDRGGKSDVVKSVFVSTRGKDDSLEEADSGRTSEPVSEPLSEASAVSSLQQGDAGKASEYGRNDRPEKDDQKAYDKQDDQLGVFLSAGLGGSADLAAQAPSLLKPRGSLRDEDGRYTIHRKVVRLNENGDTNHQRTTDDDNEEPSLHEQSTRVDDDGESSASPSPPHDEGQRKDEEDGNPCEGNDKPETAIKNDIIDRGSMYVKESSDSSDRERSDRSSSLGSRLRSKENAKMHRRGFADESSNDYYDGLSKAQRAASVVSLDGKSHEDTNQSQNSRHDQHEKDAEKRQDENDSRDSQGKDEIRQADEVDSTVSRKEKDDRTRSERKVEETMSDHGSTREGSIDYYEHHSINSRSSSLGAADSRFHDKDSKRHGRKDDVIRAREYDRDDRHERQKDSAPHDHSSHEPHRKGDHERDRHDRREKGDSEKKHSSDRNDRHDKADLGRLQSSVVDRDADRDEARVRGQKVDNEDRDDRGDHGSDEVVDRESRDYSGSSDDRDNREDVDGQKGSRDHKHPNSKKREQSSDSRSSRRRESHKKESHSRDKNSRRRNKRAHASILDRDKVEESPWMQDTPWDDDRDRRDTSLASSDAIPVPRGVVTTASELKRLGLKEVLRRAAAARSAFNMTYGVSTTITTSPCSPCQTTERHCEHEDRRRYRRPERRPCETPRHVHEEIRIIEEPCNCDHEDCHHEDCHHEDCHHEDSHHGDCHHEHREQHDCYEHADHGERDRHEHEHETHWHCDHSYHPREDDHPHENHHRRVVTERWVERDHDHDRHYEEHEHGSHQREDCGCDHCDDRRGCNERHHGDIHETYYHRAHPADFYQSTGDLMVNEREGSLPEAPQPWLNEEHESMEMGGLAPRDRRQWSAVIEQPQADYGDLSDMEATPVRASASSRREDNAAFIEGSSMGVARRMSILARHNIYRCMHGADNLVWSDELAKNAQRWADTNKSGHSTQRMRSDMVGCNLVGENIAVGNSDIEAVDKWYWEGASRTRNGEIPLPEENTSHFSQVVWKDTKKVGCGMNRDSKVFVCQYSCAGDHLSLFKENVQPVHATMKHCEEKIRRAALAQLQAIVPQTLMEMNQHTNSDSDVGSNQDEFGKFVAASEASARP